MSLRSRCARQRGQARGRTRRRAADSGSTRPTAAPPPSGSRAAESVRLACRRARRRHGCRARSAASAKGCALVAAVAEQIALEAQRGQARQRRQDARAVVRVGRMQLEIEQRAVLVAHDGELDAFHQLAAIDAARPGGRSRTSQRLSATTAEGSTSSPQASRQSRARCWPSRRHSPRRDQRAKLVCSVVKGIPESSPAMRHCIPPKVYIEISPMTRLRKLRSGLQPRRCTPTRSRSMASSSASTAKMNTSMSARTFQPSLRLGRGTGRAGRQWQIDGAQDADVRHRP